MYSTNPTHRIQKFNPLQMTLKLFFIFLMKLNVKEPEIPKSAIENEMYLLPIDTLKQTQILCKERAIIGVHH
jgi:hypothetical protein